MPADAPGASKNASSGFLSDSIKQAGSSVSLKDDHKRGTPLHDAAAGFVGGALGILSTNSLDLLKVRAQAASTHGPMPGPSSKAIHPESTFLRSDRPEGIIRGLRNLYRTEGWRVFFAGSLAPVAMYAPLDAFFFSVWGRTMDMQQQDRDDPTHLAATFLSGATAGGMCALFQTPIEVVKVRAQMERQSEGKKRKGTIGITMSMYRKEGFRGFFAGLWPTFFRDVFANAIFFSCYHACRRLCRGEHPFLTRREALDRKEQGISSIFRVASLDEADRLSAAELGRIFTAAGIAGAACMFATYPLDAIKTLAQRSVKANVDRRASDLSMRGLARQIWREGSMAPEEAARSRLRRFRLQCGGFTRGLRLGVVTSALQSAMILPTFEFGTAFLGDKLHDLPLT